MADAVSDLIVELEGKGWSSSRTPGRVVFSRGDVTITGHNNYVESSVGGVRISGSELTSQFWATMEQLKFLITEMRRFAKMADTGELHEMARWVSAKKAIQESTWEEVSKCKQSLSMMEEAVKLLSINKFCR